MKKTFKRLLIIAISLFVLLNVLIAIHSYSLTHFDEDAPALEMTDMNLSMAQKLKLALSGIDLPKPRNTLFPDKEYREVSIPVAEGKALSAWHIRTDSVKEGTVLLFHGYMDKKSSMLSRADELLLMGYDVLLVDFMGSGDSYGNQTTIGYLEADNVVATYNCMRSETTNENIFLFGFSMGSAAILKAQHDAQMDVSGIILEASYATLEGTIGNRAELLNIPRQPMSALFTFWMGVVNGFNGFDAKPIEFAKKIEVPTLVMCGLEDPNIPEEETREIFDAVGSSDKVLYLFEKSKHESYLLKHKEEWKAVVGGFLENRK